MRHLRLGLTDQLPSGRFLSQYNVGAQTRRTANNQRHGEDRLDIHPTVALVLNGLAHAVMMAAPADLNDFALGFALTDGLIDSPAAL